MKKLWLLGILALLPMGVMADTRLENAAERVENQVERDYILRRFDFETDTVGNSIHLRGSVRTRAQRNRALTIARRFARGYRVVNRIRISGRETG